MRAMMHAFVDKSRSVDGSPTSLAEIGYLSVGMDDGYQLCNCSGSHGQEDLYPHSLYNVSCSGDNSGQEANACHDGRVACVRTLLAAKALYDGGKLAAISVYSELYTLFHKFDYCKVRILHFFFCCQMVSYTLFLPPLIAR